MKKTKIGIIFLLFLTTLFCSCEKDSDNSDNPELKNTLIGTWKWISPSDYYWYEFNFEEDITGTRVDADNENDNFTYSFTESKINFKSGFPNGEYDYKVIDNQKLVIFGDTLIKQ